MSNIEDLPQDVIKTLEVYKRIVNNQPVSLTIEDMPKIQALVEELKAVEESSKETFAQIETLKTEILERRQKIQELRANIDPRLLYIKEGQAIPATPAKTSNEGNGITKEAILKALESGSKGNAEILKALNLPSDKTGQNKVYGLCKTLQNEGKVISADRKWQIVT